jgi:hypothetical protein
VRSKGEEALTIADVDHVIDSRLHRTAVTRLAFNEAYSESYINNRHPNVFAVDSFQNAFLREAVSDKLVFWPRFCADAIIDDGFFQIFTACDFSL